MNCMHLSAGIPRPPHLRLDGTSLLGMLTGKNHSMSLSIESQGDIVDQYAR